MACPDLMEIAETAVFDRMGSPMTAIGIRPDWRKRVSQIKQCQDHDELIARLVDAIERPYWELNDLHYGGA